jgi:chorismate dehydratase
MNERRRLGVPPVLWFEPLTKALLAQDAFEVLLDSTTRNAVKLREHSVHAAFLSPIDYAREGSLYRIVPRVAVSARTANNSVVMHFRKGIHTISTVAVDPRSVSEIILAKVVLAEEFDVEPKIVPVEGSLIEMLRRADAAVLIGDEALRQTPAHGSMIDLVEAWTEMTELPFVHGFWCCHEGQLTNEHIRWLEKSAHVEGATLDGIATEAVATHQLLQWNPVSLRAYLDSFTYELTAEVEEGIREFLTFAYYHGVLPDVPELNYLSTEAHDESSDG